VSQVCSEHTVTFVGLRIEGPASRGGVLRALATTNAVVSLVNTTISGSVSDGSGAALSAVATSLRLYRSLMQDCRSNDVGSSSDGGGGAVYAVDSFVTSLRSSFVGCSSAGSGGAMHIRASRLFDVASSSAAVSQSTFTGCSADAGGAVASYGSLVRVASSVFTNSSAVTAGGTMVVSGASIVAVTDVVMQQSVVSAGSGGCFSISQLSLGTLTRVTGIECRASKDGGAVHALVENDFNGGAFCRLASCCVVCVLFLASACSSCRRGC
jgi:hypothetical protein